MSTPAGWYPTPEGGQRFWDGTRWTLHRPAPAPGPHLPQPYAAPRPPAPPAAYPVPGYQIAPRSPALGLLASFFIPGLGSMLVGRVGIGLTILGLYLLACLFALILIGIPFMLGIWIWGMVDGYTGAQRWNLRHGIIS